MSTPVYLRHGRIRLALHELKSGAGRPLLLLHGLGEHSPRSLPDVYAGWSGSVHALDFTGHGESTVPRGGGYMAEILMADADAALSHLGTATVVGRGLGAYIALLIAGGRPAQVRGAILRDGPGLAGGGAGWGSPFVAFADARRRAPPDPFALVELAIDIRPPDYATTFARQAAAYSGLERPLSVCARERAGWLLAVTEELGVEQTSLAEALQTYATLG